MDQIWFDSQDTAGLVWSDDTEKCTLLALPGKGKQIAICHAGSTEAFVHNSLLLCEKKKLSQSFAGCHDDINGGVFEDWFENSLLKNLPQDRKVLIVMNNAKYHSRLSEKTPTINMKKRKTSY